MNEGLMNGTRSVLKNMTPMSPLILSVPGNKILQIHYETGERRNLTTEDPLRRP